MLRKEYLGEYALPLDEWFRKDVFAYDDPDNEVRHIILKVNPGGGTLSLSFFYHSNSPSTSYPHARRPMRPVLCSSKLVSSTFPIPRFGPISRRPTTHSSSALARALSQLPQYVLYPRSSKLHVTHVCHASQTQGIGTIRSHQHGPAYEDDGLSSDDADGQDGEASDDDDETEPKSSTPDDSNVFTPRSHSSSPDLTPTPSPTAASLPPAQQARHFLPSIPKILTRRPVRRTNAPPDTPLSPQVQPTSTSRLSSVATPPARRKKIPGPWHGQKSGAFELEADNDILGIVMLEIHSATDLPRLRNSESFKHLLYLCLIGFESDAYRVGYGPFRGRLIRQEGFSNTRHTTFA